MSLYLATSPKHCGSSNNSSRRLKWKNLGINRKLFWSISTILTCIIGTAFLVYLILHPSKPEFLLKDAGVYRLNLLSSTRLLNSTVQFTLLSKNPNAHVGVYYDGLRAYAVYKGQRITTISDLPPFYQGHDDISLLSAVLPVADSFGYEISRDPTAGEVLVRIKLDGYLRWKIGNWVSDRYGVNVDCLAIMGFNRGDVGSSTSRLVTSTQGTMGRQCSTNL